MSKTTSENKPTSNLKALLPILIFLILYLGNGMYFEYFNPIEGKMGFCIMSVVVAFGISLIVAILQKRQLTFDEKIHICAHGIGDDNITIDSRISHLDKIGEMLAMIGWANLLIGVANTFSPSRLGWINLLCATLLMYALGRIHGKKESLLRERQLHE